MKVKQKDLLWSSLPSAKDKKKLLAATGMNMEPGPKMPGMKNLLKNLPDDYFDNLMKASMPKTVDMTPTPDVLGKLAPQQINPPSTANMPKPQMPKTDGLNKFNPGNAALLALSTFDKLLPSDYNKQTVIQPQLQYNQNPYGTGSQALMDNGGYIMGEDENNSPMAKDGKWIQKAINPKHKGYCTPMTKSTCTPRRKALAKRFKSGDLSHDDGGMLQYQGGYNTANPQAGISGLFEGADQWFNMMGDAKKSLLSAFGGGLPIPMKHGGIIPDNMSPFNPHKYQDGGKAKPKKGSKPTPEEKTAHLLYSYPTPRDRASTLFGTPSALATSDSAQYVAGYRSPLSVQDAYPLGFALNNPFQSGYYDKMKANNQPMPEFFPSVKKNEDGGNINGGANINIVGANYPNSDLLEQWLLYKQGGEVGPKYPNKDLIEQWIPWMTGDYEHGGKVREVGAKYPNTDLLEQFIQYCDSGGVLPDPKKPRVPNADPLNKTKKVIYGQPTDLAEGQLAMDRGAVNLSAATDLIHQNIASGMLPNQTTNDAILRGTIDPKLYSYLYEFNQRSDIKGLTPEQRVKLFYDVQTNDEDIQAMKSRLKSQGYGPSYQYNRSKLGAATPTFTQNSAANMKNGGILYDDGGAINTMWGGNVELASYNPYDGGMAEFKGASHENGGIGMAFNNNPVEVEGGEFASRDKGGNLNIYGNMYLPGTKTKFKSVAKEIAKKENRYDFLKTRGSELVNNSSPNNRFEQLTFNSGKLMMEGGAMGQEDITQKKERLASLQNAMLDTADEFGIDPQEMSKGKVKKAKGGASIPFFANGGKTDPNDPTRADRNNNPGNIKYGKFAKKYGATKDKDGFAVFPSREKGLSAMQNLLKSPSYENLTVQQAIKKWTGGDPYKYSLGPLTGRKVSDLSADQFNDVINTMVRGEGTKYGPTGKPLVPKKITPNIPNIQAPPPFGLPPVTLTPNGEPAKPNLVTPPYDELNPPPDRGPLPSNVEPLHLNQVLGEIYAAATNKVEPVPAQTYNPQLFTPYQVSFQDRINRNQNAFSAIQRSVGAANPSALGQAAAQLYEANNSVAGDEFRTNQAISNDISNKNVALLNDAQMKNLGIADTQMVRQSTAKSKTNQMNQMIVNSLASKYAQNDLENKTLAAYENLYDYRFDPTEDGGLYTEYYGPDAVFNFNGTETTPSKDVRTTSRYDNQGNLKGYSEQEDSELKKAERRINIESKRRRLPLLTVPKLDR